MDTFMSVPPVVPKRTSRATTSRQLKAEKELNDRMKQIDEVMRLADDDAWKLTVRDISNATGLPVSTTYRTMREMGLIDEDYWLPKHDTIPQD